MRTSQGQRSRMSIETSNQLSLKRCETLKHWNQRDEIVTGPAVPNVDRYRETAIIRALRKHFTSMKACRDSATAIKNNSHNYPFSFALAYNVAFQTTPFRSAGVCIAAPFPSTCRISDPGSAKNKVSAHRSQRNQLPINTTKTTDLQNGEKRSKQKNKQGQIVTGPAVPNVDRYRETAIISALRKHPLSMKACCESATPKQTLQRIN